MIDLNQLQNDSTHQTDICIIGSGAMGLALANEFLNCKQNVLLLESGSWRSEQATQQLYDVVNVGTPLPGANKSRFRIFGGTTTQWGGQALPFFPIDFQERPWVTHSGWPIQFADLLPFYHRAGAFMQIDSLNYDTDLFEKLNVPPPPFDPELVRYHFSKWAPQPNLRLVYASRIEQAPNVRVMFHANVTQIVLGESRSAIDHVQIRSLEGKQAKIIARSYILAVGAIETARLLLASNKQIRAGLGNDHDLVGRFFQEHPSKRVGRFLGSNDRVAQRLFHLFYRRGLKYSVRFSAAEPLLRKQQLLNTTGGIDFESPDSSPYIALKSVARSIIRRQFSDAILSDSVKALAGLPTLIRPVYEYAIRHRGYTPAAICKAWIMTEQEPNPDSRISLSEKRDALNMPRAAINWRVTHASWKTMVEYATILRQQLAAIGLDLELFPQMQVDNPDWRQLLTDSLHHIGTTRMAADPAEGVVDSQCKVFGIDNLFIAGSSVFPTSGHSNPTLTALALAIRLADHLKIEMA